MSHEFLQIGHHRLPLREIWTCEGRFAVPRYVYRAGKDNAWRTDMNRQDETKKLYRHFPDADYGSVQQGLTMAIEHLYSELPNYRSFEQTRPGSSHWYQVREVPDSRTGLLREWVQTYICGYHGKLRTVCFWVGTPTTRSDLRLRTAIDRAIGTRCWSIEMIKSEGRDVLFQSPVPRHVERFAC